MAWFEPWGEDAPKLAWLAATDAAEEVLEPALPIIDPHHHLWDARAPLSTTMRCAQPLSVEAISTMNKP